MKNDILTKGWSTITTIKLKRRLCYILCGGVLFCFWLIMNIVWEQEALYFNSKLFSLKNTFFRYETKSENTNSSSWTEFVIKQPGCRIPGMILLGPSVSEYVQKQPVLYCDIQNNKRKRRRQSNWLPALVKDETNSLFVDAATLQYYAKQHVNCTFRSFRRPKINENKAANSMIDDEVEYSTEIKTLNIDEPTEIETESEEFVKVVCADKANTKAEGKVKKPFYRDYFAFVPLKTEVEKRCDEFDRNAKVDRLNVAVIGLDALSRLNFHRQMGSSATYLSQQMEAIEMVGFNKVGDNTFPNLVPLLADLSVEELKNVCWPSEKDAFDECPFIWKKFQRNGYRTIFAEDCPSISVFNYIKNGFLRQPTDYYLRPFYTEAERDIGSRKPGNCLLCLGSRLSLAVLLNYATKVLKTFGRKHFFGFFWSTSYTHDFFNLPAQGDEAFLEFLKEVHENDLLNETVLMVISDHGLRWGDFRETYQGHLEERLPLLMFVLPIWFRQKYKKATENLRRNGHRLTTHFDLHQTLLDFADLKKLEDDEIEERPATWNSRSQSLFLPVSENRNCSQVGIPKHYCTCHDVVRQVNTSDNRAITAAKALVEHVNGLLADHPECAKLRIELIEHVTVEQSTMGGNFAHNKVVSDYIITVKMYPGEGLFEGSVRHDHFSDKYKVISEVSRINAYGSQSFCVNDYTLKLYCYCRH